MKRCRVCLLPAEVPGANLNVSGVCAFCRQHDSAEPTVGPDPALREDLEKTLREARRNRQSEYDCLVPLSGGKDSCLLLYRLKHDYGLRVLAFTSNIDLPAPAWSNIRTSLARLEIDHLVHAPAPGFLRKLFRYLLCNQEARGAVYTVSYVYAPLFEGEAIRVAIEKNIPLILAGYSPGQPEPERMRYEFSPRLIQEEDWTPPHLKECEEFSEDELRYFYNPANQRTSRFPRYLAPFHAWDYDQNDVMRQVKALGLVRKSRHANPVVSNYPINWLMMYSDLLHFGYNPYAPEFAALIREGKASRSQWRVLAPMVDFMIRNRVLLGSEVSRNMKWLGLREADLKIRLPKGAYDPPLVRAAGNG